VSDSEIIRVTEVADLHTHRNARQGVEKTVAPTCGYAAAMRRQAGSRVKRIVHRTRAIPRNIAVVVRRHTPGGNRFRVSLEDRRAAISVDISADSDAMLLAFGGLKGKLDIPPFEFFSLTGHIPVKRVFVRDLQQVWYHRGLLEDAPSIDATAKLLRSMIAEQRVKRLVVVGTSMGGYAALLFGALLGADRVLSFCPQTTVDPRQLVEMGDMRWTERLGLLLDAGELEPRWLDLRPPLSPSRPPKTQFDVFFDPTFRLDLLHAERISDIDCVELHPHSGGAHLITRKMRDSGELTQILRTALLLSA
jgi:hypothetical protein